MQEGSNVVMIKPLSESFIKGITLYGFKRYPVPSDVVYHQVTLIEEMPPEVPYRVGIYLDSFPEFYDEKVGFDINLFAEVQMPPPLRERKRNTEPYMI